MNKKINQDGKKREYPDISQQNKEKRHKVRESEQKEKKRNRIFV